MNNHYWERKKNTWLEEYQVQSNENEYDLNIIVIATQQDTFTKLKSELKIRHFFPYLCYVMIDLSTPHIVNHDLFIRSCVVSYKS